jgi:hypothetical protein
MQSNPTRPSALRRIIMTVLALSLVLTGFAGTPAEAATKATFSGKGLAKSKTTSISKGIYQIDTEYSKNSVDGRPQLLLVYLRSKSGTISKTLVNTLDSSASGSTRHIVTLTDTEKLYAETTFGAPGVKWKVKLKKLSPPKSGKTSLTIKGKGPNASKLFYLPKGKYTLTVSYSGNTSGSGRGTNFAMQLGQEYPRLVINDIGAKGSAVATGEVYSGGAFWFDPTLSMPGTKWSVKIAKTLEKSPKPTISGTAKVGKKLTAKAGTWKPSGVKLKYQWYRGSKKISGATKKTYTLTSADKGKKIKVKVTGSKKGYASKTKSSKATSKVK